MAVVEQQFVWKFIDQVTNGVNRAKQAIMEAQEAVKGSGTEIAAQGAQWAEYSAKATGAMDKVQHDAVSLKTDVESAINGTDDTVKNAGSNWLSFSTKAKEAIDKVVNTAKNMREGVMNALSGAEKDVDRFGSAINKLPREKTTEIKAKIEDGNLGKFSREVRDVPKRKVTEIKAETNQSVLSRIINSFKKIPSRKNVDVEAKDHASSALSRIGAKASETGHRFSALKDIMLGTFVGGAITAGIGALGSKLSELGHEASETAKENQVMAQTWNTLTGSASKANAMVASIQHLSVTTGQSVDLVNELEQSFYHLNSSKSQADNLTKSMLNMGDAVGLSGDQLKAVSQDMTHAMATGKVTAGELNQIGGYFPMIDEAMAHACHTSVAGMRQMAQQGKISASTLEQVFNELGQDKYGKAAENMLQTMTGMERTIKARVPMLLSDFEKPFLEAKSPVYGAVSKWVTDKSTDTAFKRLGDAVSKGMQVVTKAFIGSGDTQTIEREFNQTIDNMTRAVSSFSNFVAQHATTIKATFSAMGSAVKIAFEVVGSAIKTVVGVLGSVIGMFTKTGDSGKKSANAMQTVASALKKLSENKAAIKALGDALLAFLAVKKFTGFIGGLSKVGTAIKGLGETKNVIGGLTGAFSALDASMLPEIAVVAAIAAGVVALGVAFMEAYKHCSTFRTIVNGIGSILGNIAKACVNLVKDGINLIVDAFKLLGTIAKDVWNAIPSSFKKGINTLIKGIGDFVKDDVKAWQNWSKALLELTEGHWSKAGKYFSQGFKSLLKAATDWSKASQKAWGQWTKALLQLITKHWNSVGKLFSKGWKNLQKLFKGGSKILLKGWQSLTKSIQDLWSKAWNKVSSITAKVWKDITTKVSKGAERVRNSVSQGINKIKVEWNKDWNMISSTTVHIWNDIKDKVSEGMNHVRSDVSSKMARVKADWSSAWNAIRAVASRIWGAIKADIGSAINSIASHISSTLNSISSAWSSAWNGMKSAFQSIWNGIKSAAQDGMNGVINVINGAIGGINKVWSFFTGKGTGLSQIGHVHFAKGGIVGERKGALSVINDGAGPHWKELVRTPSGEYFMSNQRNWTGLLPVGSRVYSGEETHAIMTMAGVEHYATGGIVGMQAQHFDGGGWVQDGINWAKGAWNDVKDWLGDKLDALDDFLDDPIKALKGIIHKAADALLGLVPSQYRGIGKWVVDKLPAAMKDWAVKILKPIEEKLSEEEGGSGNWREVIHHAEHLMHVHLSADQVNRLLRQIQTESGGNPHIMQQISDINSAEGHPAEGLLQFIPSTFNAWAMPGHHNIMSGLDQIMAAINCLNHGGEGGWGNIGDGHGWWTGGEVWGKQLGWVGDNTEGHEYVINPYAPSAKPLLEKAVNETMLAQPEPSQAPVHTDNASGDKADRIIELLEMLVAKDMTISLEDSAQLLRKQDAHVLRMQTKQGAF